MQLCSPKKGKEEKKIRKEIRTRDLKKKFSYCLLNVQIAHGSLFMGKQRFQQIKNKLEGIKENAVKKHI